MRRVLLALALASAVVAHAGECTDGMTVDGYTAVIGSFSFSGETAGDACFATGSAWGYAQGDWATFSTDSGSSCALTRYYTEASWNAQTPDVVDEIQGSVATCEAPAGEEALPIDNGLLVVTLVALGLFFAAVAGWRQGGAA